MTKQKAEALRDPERLLRSLADASLDAIYVKDRQSRWLFANPALERITGKRSAELLGKTDAEIYSNPEVSRAILEHDWKVMESGKPETFEEFVDLADGRHFFISVKSPRFDEKGNVNGLLGISHDVTNRKKREEKLRESEQKYRALIETTSDFVWEVDSEGRYTYCSPQMEKLWGLKPTEMIGKTPFDQMPQEAKAKSLEAFRKFTGSQKPFSGIQVPSLDGQGKHIYIELSGVPFFNGEGKLLGFRGITRDVTDRKKVEEALRKSEWVSRSRTEELEKIQLQLELKAAEVEEFANRMEDLAEDRALKLKDSERLAAIGATAGMVGHDIRNPLQAISGDLYLIFKDLVDLPDGELKQSILESLKDIDASVDYINKIVQDLQDFSRPIKPVASRVDVGSLLEEVLFKSGIPEGIEITCNVGKEAKEFMTDPELLKRALANLTSNAVQAMPKGGKLDVHAFLKAGDLVLTVKDSGMGISEEVRSKLFTPLFTTKSRGQGFGLAVVKRLTEALGGTVTFESKVGKGTKFTLSFPKT